MITITKDKIYRSTFSLKRTRPDSESVTEIGERDIIFNLGDDVELGEDVTFQRLFDLAIFHKEFFNILYSDELGGLEVDDFIADYEQPPLPEVPNQEFSLMISWAVVVYEVDYEIEYFDYPIFEAFGKIDNTIDEEDYPISLAFTPLCELREKIVFLDNTYEIQNEDSYEDEMEAAFKANYKPFKLYDMFAGILRDISHYGNPKDRDEKRREVMAKTEEIEQWLEDGGNPEDLLDDGVSDEIEAMINKLSDDDDDDGKTFWDTLYPKDKPTGKTSQEILEDSIIAIMEGSGLSLEQQMEEATEAEDYEKAAKLKKLIEKRDEKKRRR